MIYDLEKKKKEGVIRCSAFWLISTTTTYIEYEVAIYKYIVKGFDIFTYI